MFLSATSFIDSSTNAISLGIPNDNSRSSMEKLKHFFPVTIPDLITRDTIMNGGPWLIDGAGLSLQNWQKNLSLFQLQFKKDFGLVVLV